MLPYFPALFPDELLYSVIARYHRHVCSPGPKATLEDLFGNRSVRASADLQGHLGALADRLPPGLCLDAGRLARVHTLLPYYTAFSPEETARVALEAMTRGSTDGLHLRLGIAAGAVRAPVALRFCPACHAETLAVRGERCWRRAHQLPGVLVCPEHGAPLRDSTVVPSATGQHEFIAAVDETCPDGSEPVWSPEARALLQAIATASAALLDTGAGAAPDARQAAIHASLRERGFDRGARAVNQRALLAFQERVFTPLAPVLPLALEPGWLTALTRRWRGAHHPLCHVLFDVLMAHAAPVAAPVAPAPRRFLADDAAFEARLRAVLAVERGLRRAARSLGVDPLTVRRHAARLDIATPWKALAESSDRSQSDPQEKHRSAWTRLQTTDPSLSRKALRQRLSATFAWLRRHDRAWLEAHSPQPTRRPAPGPRRGWAAEDAALADALREAAAELKARVPPVRITLAALERMLGRPGWIAPRRAKLPLTAATVVALAEGLDAFRRRRFAWAQAEHPEAPLWRLRRYAGLPDDWRPTSD
ncbi:TnsD family Tn7-like transposition protein [Rubrimonas sp.]|uniref:TnsD family Tn7-like transposition protein n=1 Tax=Rubrimonas sp. TaxID=2036015 RepID=UPI002FDE1CB3